METYFPKFETLEDVKKSLRGGGFSGLAFAAMVSLALALYYFGVNPFSDETTITAEDRFYTFIGIGIELALVLFLTWRLWAGHGYVSGIILLLIFLIEIATKIATGTSGAGWIIAYIAIIIGFVNAIRAAFAYKRVSKSEVTADTF